MSLSKEIARIKTIAVGVAALAWASAAQAEWSWKGFAGLEGARYPKYVGVDGVVNPRQERDNLAFKGQLEIGYTTESNWSVGVRAFVREDKYNDDRDATRFDEAWIQYATDDWDLRVGNQLVTWGSVESVSHLDIVNARDYEEDIVEPMKIGQTAARMRWRFDSSDLALYWLPYYEPSQFAGRRSYYSIGGGIPEDYPDSGWKSDQWALRYFQSGDGFDWGLSYFNGFERNASFDFDPERGELVGETYRARRLGLEMTKVIGDWLLKGEFVYRHSGQQNNRDALLYTVGVEYTASSIWRHSDLTFYGEYLATSRNVAAHELMQNDLFAALRWTVNDRHQQRLLLGTFLDLDNTTGQVYRLEYTISPIPDHDVVLRYTDTRNYYPSPRHTERDDGAISLFLRRNF